MSQVETLFRASGLMIHRWSKHESITAADCAAVSLVTLLVMFPLLIISTVFHVFNQQTHHASEVYMTW
jgi:hypothetical protein